ncbi:MAG: glycerol-3-phosphate dehydrogenase, anaerobic, subunit [Candidatus Saccharibacteria bacterium]|nr:glycerol-3-phosphate dehydrogenase, anaerobic, subunit [Candidatus Saccharibacteria bacterium]
MYYSEHKRYVKNLTVHHIWEVLRDSPGVRTRPRGLADVQSTNRLEADCLTTEFGALSNIVAAARDGNGKLITMNASGKSGVAPPKVLKRVVIIGGGATGTGIARDAAARGYDVVLIDRGELGNGTSGNFHGILHSGARYAVNDVAVAAECFQENQLLRHIVPSAITDTGGLFVALSDEEVIHSRVLISACANAGIPVQVLTAEQAFQVEPGLSKSLKMAFTVPDGFIDGAELLRLNRLAAVEAKVPATFLTDHIVVGLERTGDAVSSVSVRDTRTGTVEHINCDYVVNASGVWAGEIADMAGLRLDMVYDKGAMLIFDQQYNRAVLNRCRPENDGDLLASHAGQSIMGTTSRIITDPDDCSPTQEEIDILMHEGAAMVPALRDAKILFAYAGVRPLLKENGKRHAPNTRSMSRSFRVLDHTEQGIGNFISIVGGKVTLYRRMAEAVVDLLDVKSSR